MKAPVKWLLEYTDLKNINTDAEIANLASELTLSGSKVETVDKIENAVKNVVVTKCVSMKRHENSDRMFVCMMDSGDRAGVLQIVTAAQNVREGAHIPVALDGSTLADGTEIKTGKLRGVASCGMMCSFEEIGLKSKDYEGGIDDGVMILDDLAFFKGQDLDALIGTDIIAAFGLGYDDSVIDFEITSNRADCFSILGLAREAAVTMGGTFKLPDISVKENSSEKTEDNVKVSVESDLCTAYYARCVKNVKIGPSPKWMKDRLEACGVRSINNIVDITNYVMLEFGQPMHAFDKRFIRGNHIIVRRAGEGEIIKTLDGADRKMNSNMLVIADEGGSIGIAGVMGGENSEIQDDTTEIVFESAIFDAVTVRRGAKYVGLRTESSSRFEKGLDAKTARKAIDRAANLVELLACGDVTKGVIAVETEKANADWTVDFRPEKINEFLGTDIPAEKMVDILTNLECKVDVKNNLLTPPSFRQDLKCMADIAEEVARFYGYNNIESSLLKKCEMTLGSRTKLQRARDYIRTTMAGFGYHEMLTYSFESPNVYDKLALSEDDAHRNYVKISNPLGEDYSAMRTSMIPTVLKTLAYNNAQRTKNAWLFEIAYVYIKGEDEEKLPEHREQLAIGAYGDMDFFKLKGQIETIFSSLKIDKVEFKKMPETSFMHPGRSAEIFINGRHIGFMGQIFPGVAENFGAPRDSYVAVIDVEPLAKAWVEIPKSRELPKFPAAERDIAVVLDKEVPQGDVINMIIQRGGKILESCELFDCYEGAQVGENKKSLAYALKFRAADHTLSDEEIEKPMKKILNGLASIGAELR